MHDWNDSGNGMNPWHGEGSEHAFGPWHWVGMSIGLAVLMAAVVAIILVYRRFGANAHHAAEGAPGSPEEVLRGRFARGEIEADEFRSRMQVLAEEPNT